MSILLIENQIVANVIAESLSGIEVFPTDKFDSLETLAETIPDDRDLYIINANLRIGNGICAANDGIQLLKQLRLHHNNSHVIIYSWFDKEMLMTQDIRNAILFTKGVSFYRLPDFLDFVRVIDMEDLSKIKADKQELTQLFRAEYNPDDRHFNANMIGVWQLMRVQEAYEEIYGNQQEESTSSDQDDDARNSYNESRQRILDYLNTYNGRLVQYLGHYRSVESMKEILRSEIIAHDNAALLDKGEKASEAINSIDLTVKDIDFQIKTLESLMINSNAEKKGTPEEGFLSMMLNLFDNMNNRVERKVNERVKDTIAELESQKANLEQEKQQWLMWQKFMEARNANNAPNNVITIGKGYFDGIEEKMVALRTRKPRIIYVDDMAEEGWASVLRRMIYGNDTKNYNLLTPICPQKEDTPESIVLKIQEANINETDMLILDLRLKDERGYFEPSELSGFRVLELLQKQIFSCPILIITASNKVWSLKKAFNGNVVSFWIKAGMEQYDNDKAFVQNYIDLVEVFYSLTSEKWFFDTVSTVKKMAAAIKKAKPSSFWWETLRVQYQEGYNRKLTEKNDVIKILDRVVSKTQDNLRQLYYGLGNMNFTEVCQIFVTELQAVLEKITDIEQRSDHRDLFNLASKLLDCKNSCGFEFPGKFLSIRNHIVHNAYNPSQQDMKDYLCGVYKCLLGTPSEVKATKLNSGHPVFLEVTYLYKQYDSVLIGFLVGSTLIKIEVANDTEIARQVVNGDFVMVVQNKTENPLEPTYEIIDYFKMK
jgi:response regulator of citrate/malate metabolism